MEITMKNLLLAGIGSMAVTFEKAQVMVDDLVRKGELTVSEGKELNEELKRKVESKKAEAGDKPLTETVLRDILSGLNLANKQDLDEIRQRLDRLESR